MRRLIHRSAAARLRRKAKGKNLKRGDKASLSIENKSCDKSPPLQNPSTFQTKLRRAKSKLSTSEQLVGATRFQTWDRESL
jgi:hypothetical protein